jgi:hypothetical protein
MTAIPAPTPAPSSDAVRRHLLASAGAKQQVAQGCAEDAGA